MLGAALVAEAAQAHTVQGTSRGTHASFLYVTSREPATLSAALAACDPDVVVNCAGVVKQIADPACDVIEANAWFPHFVHEACRRRGTRLIHISTDCVFSGLLRGPHTESTIPDPRDLYGRTKLVGEVASSGALTLRTSFIGFEPSGRRATGLLSWFLGQESGATVQGFAEAKYTGLTAKALSRVVLRVIEAAPDLSGIYHVGGEAITKYELLMRLKQHFRRNVAVVPTHSFVCDRRLGAALFERDTGIRVPTWDEMIAELE